MISVVQLPAPGSRLAPAIEAPPRVQQPQPGNCFQCAPAIDAPAGVRSATNAHWSRARSADVRIVQGVHTNYRVSYSAERARVVAVADVVGLELLSYNKVKACISSNEPASPDWLPPILRFPLLVEWLLACRSNRGRQYVRKFYQSLPPGQG